jgi:hypothetical protein
MLADPEDNGMIDVPREDVDDWEPTLEEEFAGRMDAADRAVWAEHHAAVRAEQEIK